jgi:hypothetical protein
VSLSILTPQLSPSEAQRPPAEAQPPPPGQRLELRQPPPLPIGCLKTYTRAAFRAATRRAFRRPPYTTRERRRLGRMVRCGASPRSRALMRRYRARHKRAFKRRQQRLRALAALTPFRGPNGTRWAIPFRIVRCESTTRRAPQGGDWGAANSSGAIGPYQLLGKGAPWPVRTAAHKLAHHRIAAGLYRGGAGAHHWAQCL